MGRGKHLTWNDRLLIERYMRSKTPITQIARYLRVSRQTIYNELKHGSYERLDKKTLNTFLAYSPEISQARADSLKSNRGPQLKIGKDIKLANYIEHKIVNDHYSPAAVLAHIANSAMAFTTTICKTTLYSYIRKGVFLRLTYSDLPNRGQYRKRQYHHVKSNRATAGRSIEARPDISDRSEFGHWEMDTVIGKRRTKPNLLVLSERKTRYELIVKLPDKTSQSVITALGKIEQEYGKEMFNKVFRSITVDNGVEFSRLTKSVRTELYYCHPYSAYERGTNENINKMIRRFFPKGTDFRGEPPEYIRAVQNWINDYPREILNYQSAAMLFQNELHKLSITQIC